MRILRREQGKLGVSVTLVLERLVGMERRHVQQRNADGRFGKATFVYIYFKGEIDRMKMSTLKHLCFSFCTTGVLSNLPPSI